MDVEIFPSEARGAFFAPPSKSMAHRYIICASLSKDESKIDNITMSEDIKHTVACMKNLGAQISKTGSGLLIHGTESPCPLGEFDCGESGSTLRFILPVCLTQGKKCIFTGSRRLFERPLEAYEELFRGNNISFLKENNRIITEGILHGGKYDVDASVSSQFVSGLLFALPICEGDSEINLLDPVSRPYIDMTVQALSLFGIKTERDGNRFFVPGRQLFKGTNAVCEGDYSASAVFFALNRLGGQVDIHGLSEKSIQADKVCDSLLCALSEKAQTVDISDCPDLAPVLFAFAAVKNGGTFTGTQRLRYKESDRVESMIDGLKHFGIKTVTDKNTVTVFPSDLKKPRQPLDCRGDHRIAMALSLLLSLTGGILHGAECVNKSMPDFFERLTDVNIKSGITG